MCRHGDFTLREVMETDMVTLSESDSLTSATNQLASSRYHGLLVLNAKGDQAGVLTVQDIDRAQTGGDHPLKTVIVPWVTA